MKYDTELFGKEYLSFEGEVQFSKNVHHSKNCSHGKNI